MRLLRRANGGSSLVLAGAYTAMRERLPYFTCALIRTTGVFLFLSFPYCGLRALPPVQTHVLFSECQSSFQVGVVGAPGLYRPMDL